jgi:hypothetical protein
MIHIRLLVYASLSYQRILKPYAILECYLKPALLFLLMITVSFNLFANPFFAKADLKAGKVLVEENCVSCHASSYGGDGSEIYTRPFHKVESSKGLVAQVRACNTNLNLQWFDEDEFNASAYLNKQYYQFDH